jgi:ankyrin repeat protein
MYFVQVSRLLLMSGAWPDYTSLELEQAPLLAVYSHLGNIDMVSLLLEYSADTNRANNRYCTMYTRH